MQGQIDHVRGFFDGEDFEVHGALNLDSVNVMGQQITKFESPLHVAKGRAGLEDIRGSLLGGTISGRVELSLDATPQYAATIELQGADLERYAKTLPGKQIVQRPARRPDRPERPGPRPADPAGDGRGPRHQGGPRHAPHLPPARQHPPAPVGDQVGVRLGRRRHLDPQRRVVPRPDQVHRQRLQPPGPGDAGRAGQPRPPAPRPLRPRPDAHPRPQRRRPRGERPVLHRPRQGDPGQSHASSSKPSPSSPTASATPSAPWATAAAPATARSADRLAGVAPVRDTPRGRTGTSRDGHPASDSRSFMF